MGRGFVWDRHKLEALQLQWQGKGAREIAARLGTTERTVQGWQRRPAFKQRYTAMAEELIATYHHMSQVHWQQHLDDL